METKVQEQRGGNEEREWREEGREGGREWKKNEEGRTHEYLIHSTHTFIHISKMG